MAGDFAASHTGTSRDEHRARHGHRLMLQDQARPARAEAEGEEEEMVAPGQRALPAHIAEVDDVIAAHGVPDAGDVLRPDSAYWDAEQLREDRPAPKADIAGNDPANVRQTQACVLDSAADGALGHRKIGG